MKIELVPVDKALEALFNDEPAYILIEINEDTTAAELNMADKYMVIRDAIPPEPVPDPEPKPVEQPKKPKPKSQQKIKMKQPKIDHGKIVALAKAGWSTAKIADEMGCSGQTVLNHLKKEDISEVKNEHAGS